MNPDAIIIGAGAAGLMAARELGKAGKKVLVLEARDRIGGRIFPLNESEFGYPAQGGAEWVHGEAPITRALVKEAGLSIIHEDGEVWNARNGELAASTDFAGSHPLMKEKLDALTEDLPIADFLEQNFGGDEHANLRNSIIKMAEGYDAADPKLVSTCMIRDEWLKGSDWSDGRIKEGYTALLKFLENECKKYKVDFVLNSPVKKIELKGDAVFVSTANEEFETAKVIVTVPLPILKEIEFKPSIDSKLQAVLSIGFGNVIKVLIKFKDRWWERGLGKDLTKMSFLLSNQKFMTWWTQYPVITDVLVGWMAGPEAAKYTKTSDTELLDMALDSLTAVFKMSKDSLKDQVVLFKVFNWPADPFTKGAYSYTTYKTKDAYEKAKEPIGNSIFFAGEAMYSGHATATVEGALGSGLETAKEVLALMNATPENRGESC